MLIVRSKFPNSLFWSYNEDYLPLIMQVKAQELICPPKMQSLGSKDHRLLIKEAGFVVELLVQWKILSRLIFSDSCEYHSSATCRNCGWYQLFQSIFQTYRKQVKISSQPLQPRKIEISHYKYYVDLHQRKTIFTVCTHCTSFNFNIYYDLYDHTLYYANSFKAVTISKITIDRIRHNAH